MMQRLLKPAIAVALLAVGFFWWLTEPMLIESSQNVELSVDVKNGERLFWAGGCASCHADKNAQGDQKRLLGGGHRLETPFGIFVTPNISPDTDTGIGAWSELQFANAMMHGTSPEGLHYYPSFPYASYNKISAEDVSDLFGYIKSLPPVSRENQPHELALPFQWRRPLGLWKLMFANPKWELQIDEEDALLERGRYLVEAIGHCAECHTPRNLLGGIKKSFWLAGGPSPEGEGRIPNITPHADGIGSWSEDDIVYYMESGFTPDFDSVGGSMVSVQENMAKLPKSDLEAIAAYLKAVPAIGSN